ncbi:MAG: hypothetical protein GQ578_09330 [Desulfuromonadaceae bacterium]|nr:hypothetical protein [Desulfuromonadaceae bacterium]
MNLPEDQLKANTLQRRLGDYLIAAGQLTPEQLDEAIEYQCIYGGRLGTSLVELGFVNEELLARILSQQLRLHYIKPELLMDVSQNILDLIPKKFALKYQIVPYRKDQGKLYLAMNDVTNLAVIDELSFQLNHIIIPLAIPEIRLMLALKKHYGLKLSPRFESLEAQLKKRSKAVEKPTAKRVMTDDKKEAWPLLGDEEYSGEAANDEPCFGLATSPGDISQTSLFQQLATAGNRDDIAKALTAYLGQEFAACGLLMVRSPNVTGWMASFHGTELSGFDQLSIPLNGNSIFSQVVESRSHYLGPVIETPDNCTLLQCFNAKPTQNALIIPLLVRDRLISILYLQDNLEQLELRFAEVQNIARKTEMSFTLLILKNKILTT